MATGVEEPLGSDEIKTVSVVIVNYNGRNALSDTLTALQSRDDDLVREIILADNASTDDSVDVAKRVAPEVRIVSASENRGPNVARNLGLLAAKGDAVLFLDNDITVAPDFVRRAVDVLTRAPAAGAVGAEIRIKGEPETVQYRGVNIHYAGAAIHAAPDNGPYTAVGALSAGALLVRRATALAVGAFDEDFMFGWEDGDFTFRLNGAGHGCFVANGAIVYHAKGVRSWRWLRYQVRNRWWFAIKNYDTRTFWLAFPAFAFYQISVGCLCVVKGHGMAFLQGSLDVLRTLPELLRKRRDVMAIKRRGDGALLCGDPIDVLGVGAESGLIRWANTMISRVLGVYWRMIRPFLRVES